MKHNAHLRVTDWWEGQKAESRDRSKLTYDHSDISSQWGEGDTFKNGGEHIYWITGEKESFIFALFVSQNTFKMDHLNVKKKNETWEKY